MGCDIHLHTEVKINGVWHHYSAPSISRNYSLFAKMAGVRGDEKPVAEPRGIPEDATALTKFDYAKWGIDAHTPSWLNAWEIAEVSAWADKAGGERWQKSPRIPRLGMRRGGLPLRQQLERLRQVPAGSSGRA